MGTPNTDNQFSTASQGAASTVMYVGNAIITVVSDVRVKRNRTPYGGDALMALSKLKVEEYEHETHMPFGGYRGRHVGLTAQNIYEVAPWAVNTQGGHACSDCLAGRPCTKHGPWGVRQELLIGLVVAAIHQLEARVGLLEGKLR